MMQDFLSYMFPDAMPPPSSAPVSPLRPMSVPAPNAGLYSGGQHLPSTSRQHEQANNLGIHGNGGASSSQGGATSGMVSPSSSSGNHQVSSTSPLVIPQPVKIRPPKTYHCRMCDQVFENKPDLMMHSQHVHRQDPKPFKCQHCSKSFANTSHLAQHNRIHAGIKPFKCIHCDKRFTQQVHLQQHLRTHTGERPYKCQHPGCGKAFTQLSNLQSHSRSHMTDKPYRCNSCYKCFGDEQSLRDHIPKHSETKHLKTHICHICGKSYTQETYLTRHMAKHSFDGRNPPPKPSHTAPQTPLSPPHQHPPESPIDLKPLDPHSPSVSAISHIGASDGSKSASAFMPLPHQYPSPTMINNPVPSNFPFPPPRIPVSTTLSSQLPHRYFPFDSVPQFPPKRDGMDRASMGMGMGRDGMIATQMLSLQQIKNFSTAHPSMFSKSEPSSPVHKDGFS